jgi:hypothetical protein
VSVFYDKDRKAILYEDKDNQLSLTLPKILLNFGTAPQFDENDSAVISGRGENS